MINNIIKNILYTNLGRLLLSVILGLGMATLFRQMCNNKECYNFIGPKQNEIRDKIFSFDSKNSKCYTMKESVVNCGSKERSIDFDFD